MSRLVIGWTRIDFRSAVARDQPDFYGISRDDDAVDVPLDKIAIIWCRVVDISGTCGEMPSDFTSLPWMNRVRLNLDRWRSSVPRTCGDGRIRIEVRFRDVMNRHCFGRNSV